VDCRLVPAYDYAQSRWWRVGRDLKGVPITNGNKGTPGCDRSLGRRRWGADL